MKTTKAGPSPKPTRSDLKAITPFQANSNDCLAYMADIILELRQMADRGGHQTLSGLLALAHAEAEQRVHLER